MFLILPILICLCVNYTPPVTFVRKTYVVQAALRRECLLNVYSQLCRGGLQAVQLAVMQQRRAKRYEDLAAGKAGHGAAGIPAAPGAAAARHAEAVAAAQALVVERPALAPQLTRAIAAAAPLS